MMSIASTSIFSILGTKWKKWMCKETPSFINYIDERPIINGIDDGVAIETPGQGTSGPGQEALVFYY
jgi:hypothetical protein